MGCGIHLTYLQMSAIQAVTLWPILMIEENEARKGHNYLTYFTCLLGDEVNGTPGTFG